MSPWVWYKVTASTGFFFGGLDWSHGMFCRNHDETVRVVNDPLQAWNSWLSVPLFVTFVLRKKGTISKRDATNTTLPEIGSWKIIGNDHFLQNTLHKKERQVFTHWCNPQITSCRLKLLNLPPTSWSSRMVERFIRTRVVGKDLISESRWQVGPPFRGLPNFYGDFFPWSDFFLGESVLIIHDTSERRTS